MNKKTNQEFAAAGVAGITGIFILAMSWSEFRAAAEDHPAIGMFIMGLVLLFMACGNLATGLSKRVWMKQMEKQMRTTGSTPSTDGVSSVDT